MNTFGLIGYPLEHSFSKQYFTEKFQAEGIADAEYKLFPIENIAEFEQLRKQQLAGLNVTIPYKEQIIPYLDELDEQARKIGAVNVIKFVGDKAIGFNTDYIGFQTSLKAFLPENFRGKALILGTGGASKAVKAALDDLSISSSLVSRNQSNGTTYKELHAHDGEILKQYHLIINTAPLGTFPNISAKPDLPYQLLTRHHYLHDLVYNPESTAFMQAGAKYGAHVKNGLDMLIGQAESAWEIWNK